MEFAYEQCSQTNTTVSGFVVFIKYLCDCPGGDHDFSTDTDCAKLTDFYSIAHGTSAHSQQPCCLDNGVTRFFLYHVTHLLSMSGGVR